MDKYNKLLKNMHTHKNEHLKPREYLTSLELRHMKNVV